MAVESKHFEHRGYEGFYRNHQIAEGSREKFDFPTEVSSLAKVTVVSAEGKGTAQISASDEAKMLFFDGKKGHENGIEIEKEQEQSFREGESVAIIDKRGYHTWLFTYTKEQGVIAVPKEPLQGELTLQTETEPHRVTTPRDRLIKTKELIFS